MLLVAIASPPAYGHSEAFREVAQTLVCGARALGYEAAVTTETDRAEPTVVLGSNLLPPLGPRAVLYNLEQAGSPWMTGELLQLFRERPVWDYSEHNASLIAALGVPRPRVVPIGWMPELKRIGRREEDIDVLFYGSQNARRLQVVTALERAGVRVQSVVGVYGAERDQLIARSRIVINVHYFESRVFEVVRVSWLLGNGRCVVSERGAAPEEEAPFEKGVAFAEYDELVPTCLRLLEDEPARARLASEGQRIMEARRETDYLVTCLEEWASAPA